MGKDGFLSRFRKTNHITTAARGSSGRIKVFFQLIISDDRAVMTVVNEKGEPCKVLPDYRLYQGDAFNVLRVFDDIPCFTAILWPPTLRHTRSTGSHPATPI